MICKDKAINIVHTIEQYEAADAAALAIENLTFPRVTSLVLGPGGEVALEQAGKYVGPGALEQNDFSMREGNLDASLVECLLDLLGN